MITDTPKLETVEEWVKRVGKKGWIYKHPDWPKDLFARRYAEIIIFIEHRWRVTDDHQEYYGCIPYLTNDVAPNELFVRWEDAPNTNIGHSGLSKKGVSRMSNTIAKLGSTWGKGGV